MMGVSRRGTAVGFSHDSEVLIVECDKRWKTNQLVIAFAANVLDCDSKQHLTGVEKKNRMDYAQTKHFPHLLDLLCFL